MSQNTFFPLLDNAAHTRRRYAELMLAYKRQMDKIEAVAPFPTPDLEAEYSVKYTDLQMKLAIVKV